MFQHQPKIKLNSKHDYLNVNNKYFNSTMHNRPIENFTGLIVLYFEMTWEKVK